MGLFTSKPMATDNKYFYSLSQTKTVLVVGLGNIGKKYESTRHNIGFTCLDFFLSQNAQMSRWINKKDLKCHISTGQFGDTRVIAIKPTTFMNLSGEAVSLISDYYHIKPEDILIVHDELDINFGHIRTRNDGSSAGNNGIQSVIDHIGEKFNRVRVGIGPKHPPKIEADKYVISPFDKTESSKIPDLEKEVISIVVEFIYSGALNEETRSFLA